MQYKNNERNLFDEMPERTTSEEGSEGEWKRGRPPRDWLTFGGELNERAPTTPRGTIRRCKSTGRENRTDTVRITLA